MSDWTRVRLGDLINVSHGYAFKGEFFHDEPPGDLLLTPGNFAIGGGFQWGKRRFYRDGPVPADYVLEPGDILITMTDLSKAADTLGYAAVVPESDVRLLHNQRLGKVLLKSAAVDKSYIHWLLRTPGYRNEILASYTGSTVKHTSPKKILAYEFHIPSLPEQRQIVAVLDTLDDKIELNRRMNETLEALARAIFKDWFVDFGPTRAKVEGRAPYLAPKLWDLFPDSLDDEDKPGGWSFDTLARLADTNSEAWTARRHPPTVEYVDLSNTKWGNIEAATWLDWEAAPSRARRIAKEGDTIVGTTRPGNGSFAYISRDGLTVSTGFAVLSPRSAMYRDTVYMAATSVENIERLANLADGHGGAYPAVKPNEVTDTVIVFPGDEVLASFADLVSPIREKIEDAKAESRTLSQTRDLLLPKLMSGKIRLAEAEKAMEAVS